MCEPLKKNIEEIESECAHNPADDEMHQEIIGSPNFDDPKIRTVDPLQQTPDQTFSQVEESLHPETAIKLKVITIPTSLLEGNNSMKTPQIISASIGALSALPKLILDAEQTFGLIPGLGAAKKASVMGDAMKIIAGQVAADSSGGQADFWAKAMDEISGAIDATVTMFKNLGVFGKSDTPVDPMTAITQAAQSLAPAVASLDPALAKTAGVVAATAEQVQAVAPEVYAAAKNFIDTMTGLSK